MVFLLDRGIQILSCVLITGPALLAKGYSSLRAGYAMLFTLKENVRRHSVFNKNSKLHI